MRTVRYAQLPRAGLSTRSGLVGLAVILSIVGFGIWRPDAFFFPLGIAYMAYGVLRSALLGFIGPHDRDEVEIAGAIVGDDPAGRVDDAAGRVDDAWGPRRRGITPKGGPA